MVSWEMLVIFALGVIHDLLDFTIFPHNKYLSIVKKKEEGPIMREELMESMFEVLTLGTITLVNRFVCRLIP